MHALLVGIGWFPPLLAILVGLSASTRFAEAVRGAADGLPGAVTGGVLVLGILIAFPLSWPVLMALGWAEGRAAERIQRGDPAATITAARIVAGEGAVLLLAATAVVAATAANVIGWWTAGAALSASLLPALVGLGHLAFSRWIRRSAPA